LSDLSLLLGLLRNLTLLGLPLRLAPELALLGLLLGLLLVLLALLSPLLALLPALLLSALSLGKELARLGITRSLLGDLVHPLPELL